MKRKILYLGTVAASLLAFSSCNDYLETSSQSKFDNSFVFSTEENMMTALMNVYTQVQTGNCLGDRITMNLNGPGSDVEVRPDITQSGRGSIINLYPTGYSDFTGAEGNSQWSQGFKAINVANEFIEGVKEARPEVLTAASPSNITQMYAEAVVLRAVVYYELVRNFGEIPLMLEPTRAGMNFAIPVTDRWDILDLMLEQVEKVAPIMLWASDMPEGAERVSRGFAYGLIAKMALTRGGYALHPGPTKEDFGVVIRDEANWRKYYEQANAALRKLVESGKHELVTQDERGTTANGEYGNPFQKNFQDQLDYIINKESLWEVAMARDFGGNWGYAYGRFHTGSSPNTNVSKAFGAIRFTPTYYYSFDDKDLRRDVTCVITGTNGAGEEILTVPGNVGDGGNNGICLNKWDKMRMANVYHNANGKSGINFVYMRDGDPVLLLAETEAVLNGGGEAASYLKMVRSRAFRPEDREEKVDNYIAGLSGDALLEAIKLERMWELGGENQRKHDLIRWGDFNKAIVDARKELQQMADDIRNQGYHTYPNGKQISKYLYTKKITAKNTIGGVTIGTTYGTPEGNTNPLLTPGWRGVGDADKFPQVKPHYILAIQGLDRHLTQAEADALLADGYTAEPWGASFLGPNEVGYSSYIGNGRGQGWWGGYQQADYDAGLPARYLCPIPGTVVIAAGVDPVTKQNILVNHYGFANQ